MKRPFSALFAQSGKSTTRRTVRRSRTLSVELLESRLAPTVNVLSYHNDGMITGLNPNETVLTPQNVNVSTFGKAFTASLDGQVWAQPLVMSGLMINGAPQVHVLAGDPNDHLVKVPSIARA